MLLEPLTLLTKALGAASIARSLEEWKSTTSCAPVIALWWD
ncbi:hypothetical protein [Leptolyngbya sp. NIES-2104]|nr:hypothetical protein [Leptolyngbya sp. NIES-2104]